MAGRIPEGIYTIRNLRSQCTARVDHDGSKIYVCSAGENACLFELWSIKHAKDGGYTIDNVGLNMIKMLDSYASAPEAKNGGRLIADRDATIFNIQSAGNDTYVIKLPAKDLLWNVDPSIVPRGDVQLRRANGATAAATQRWQFARALWTPWTPA